MNAKEIRTLRGTIKGLIATYQEAEKNRDIFTQAAASVLLQDIGNELTKKIVCACDSLDELVQKWPAHGYRPTLREPDALALADIYDWRAQQLGINVTAYRGN